VGFAVLTHVNMKVVHCFLECDAESELHCYLSTKIHAAFFSSHVFSTSHYPLPLLVNYSRTTSVSSSLKNRCTGNI